MVAVAAHGDHVGMLDDQQLVGNLSALALLDQFLLQLESARVAKRPRSTIEKGDRRSSTDQQ